MVFLCTLYFVLAHMTSYVSSFKCILCISHFSLMYVSFVRVYKMYVRCRFHLAYELMHTHLILVAFFRLLCVHACIFGGNLDISSFI